MTSQLTEWKLLKLDELGSVGRGKSKHRPRNDASLYNGTYPFFQTGDIKSANLYLTEYSQTYNEKGLAQSKLWEPGTLCITIAANIAETAILAIQGCFPDSIVGFIPYPDEADVRFIKYYIDTTKFEMQSVSRGTTQDNLSLEKLLSFEFRVPPLDTQICISDVLSAYDELIENNTRRIKVLEKMAQLLYLELLNDAPNKNITPLGQLIAILRGKSYRGDELSETSGIPFVNLKCIDRGGGFRKSGLKRFTGSYKDAHKVIPGDIVVAVTDMTQERNIVAHAARIPTLDGGFGIISMDLVKIEPKNGYNRDYIYSLLRWSGFSDEVKNHANGANVLHLIPERIADYKAHVVSRDKQTKFGTTVRPIFDLIDKLELQKEFLRKMRDLLLPKLISGEIQV